MADGRGAKPAAIDASTPSPATAFAPGAAAAPQHSLHDAADGVQASQGLLATFASKGSRDDPGTLSSSSMDSDGEMCALVSDPSGDVQLVCDSDPTHPISLAESAALRPALPTTLLQDMEAKLEADLTTILVTITFVVGFIILEFGINDLIDIYWGDDVLADIACVGVGLAVVFWVRLSKVPLMRFDRWR
ncbi:hypothetical protein GPECTOR_70g495 [Gonium pectorale]|uniref:Uncharacterized protein n=1 Tax=Gonium pectorale TaxID=33097 RepID=A0A150G368_GONPE|nr:hypothetical protein GPECTOR_70g495 [Gonium pectorale]|eukprot:KXZ44264.1 hypothetical protein GPECTOR_70g495 [Gonium pectorale]